ncbi:MAG: hypothetical protein LUF27_11300 [Lachnospiraceae bacterium]|nr:hypothetical protein [Lachnospiraceae bacterium]
MEKKYTSTAFGLEHENYLSTADKAKRDNPAAEYSSRKNCGKKNRPDFYGIPKDALISEGNMKGGTNRIYAIAIWEQLKYSSYPLSVKEICERVNYGFSSIAVSREPVLKRNTAERYLEAMVHSTFRHFLFRKTIEDGNAFYFCERREGSKEEAPHMDGKRLLPLAVLDVMLDDDGAMSAREVSESLGGCFHKSTVHRVLRQMEEYTEDFLLEYIIVSDVYGEGERLIRRYWAIRKSDSGVV